MIVGVLTLELGILDARSLKDKRRVIHSIKQKLRNEFNVSVAEVAYLNDAKRCRLGVAMVTRQSRPMQSQMDLAVELVRRCVGLTLLDYERQLW